MSSIPRSRSNRTRAVKTRQADRLEQQQLKKLARQQVGATSASQTIIPPPHVRDIAEIEGHKYLLRPGDRIGSIYRIETPLAVGGLSEIYAAWDEINDTPVVIKTPIPDKRKAALIHAQFRVLNQLADVPEVISVYGQGKFRQPNRGPRLEYYVMQVCTGENLFDLIAEQPEGLPITAVTGYTKSFCQGLGRAHERGIIWRDVSIENAMADPASLTIQLIDPLPAAAKDKAHGEIIGKEVYIAPEQAKGQEVAASDMFSLGLAMYEMATGQHPFLQGNASRTQWVTAKEAGNIGVLPRDPRIPTLLHETIEQLLQANPANRLTAQQTLDKLAA